MEVQFTKRAISTYSILNTKKKIIVTGGLGYIGSHTVVELIESGYEIVIADNLSNSDLDVLDKINEVTSGDKPKFEALDLTDAEKTFSFFQQHKNTKGVINFAALKAVGESVQKPILYYKNNLSILLNIIENMERFEMNNLIFSSSATVYGLPEHLPVNESSSSKRPTSPYGNTKKIGEEIIEDFAFNNPAFKSISLRYFNPIGAHPSGKLGERPNGIPNNLMPFITQTVSGKRKELKVFGNDYNTPDGTAIRDYLHVVDLAKAHVLALERLLANKNDTNYEVFNLGTGIGYSVLDVIKSFEKTTKKKVNYSFVDRRVGDVPILYTDPSKARDVLNWKPKYTIDDMTRSSWNFQKSEEI